MNYILEKNKFNNLDSIRTLAFISTFFAHTFNTDSLEVINSTSYKFAVQFRSVLSFGVPVFFVLSGFLISFLIIKEYENNGFFKLRKFYLRRVLRIWPVYFTVILFGFIVFPYLREIILHLSTTETASHINYALFLSNYDQIINNSLPIGVGLAPTWSVSVEEQFYLVWPLLFIFFKGRKFIFPIISLVITCTFLTVFYDLSNKDTIHCMIYLTTGSLFGYQSYYNPKFITQITRVASSIPIVVTISLFSLAYLFVSGFHYNIFVLFIAFQIGYLIVFQCHGKKMELRKIPLIERMGKYTYGLYLYHSICIFIIHILIRDILQFEDSISTVMIIKPVLSLALSILISVFSYKYFESIFLRLKNKYGY